MQTYSSIAFTRLLSTIVKTYFSDKPRIRKMTTNKTKIKLISKMPELLSTMPVHILSYFGEDQLIKLNIQSGSSQNRKKLSPLKSKHSFPNTASYFGHNIIHVTSYRNRSTSSTQTKVQLNSLIKLRSKILDFADPRIAHNKLWVNLFS